MKHLLASAAALLVSTATSLAIAAPAALIDESRLGPRLDQLDYDVHELWSESPSKEGTRTAPRRGAAKLWIALDGSYANVEGAKTWSGMVLFGGPLERVYKAWSAPPAGGAGGGGTLADPATGDQPALKPGARPARRARGEAPLPAPPPKAETPPPVVERIAIPFVVTPSVARAAVKAALRRAALNDPAARTDAMASRARVSALLPELRLRVARIVDDGQSLMPTEYDPYRTEATGGTTLWLDGRATWRLDRLVFADEEVALERIRNERLEAQGRLRNRVLESLFQWQKAQARAGDGNATAEELLAAELSALEAEAELDLLTGGWFTAWRTRQKPKPAAGAAP